MPIQYDSPDSSDPAAQYTWQDATGAVIDFSSGWTFQVFVGQPPNANAISKSSGIVGAAIAPNVVINWSPGDLAVLTPGNWTLQIKATQTGSGLVRTLTDVLSISGPALG